MIRTILCVIMAIVSVILSQTIDSSTTSPCPHVFKYDSPGEEETAESDTAKWYGIVSLSTDITLHSLYLNIILDRKADVLGNWVGEVTTEDNLNFKIENTKIQLTPDTPFPVRFFVQYNATDKEPKLSSILFNGIQICNADTSEALQKNSFSVFNIYGVNNKTRASTTIRPTTIPSKFTYSTSRSEIQVVQPTTVKSYWIQANSDMIPRTTEQTKTKQDIKNVQNNLQVVPSIWTRVQSKVDNIQQGVNNQQQVTNDDKIVFKLFSETKVDSHENIKPNSSFDTSQLTTDNSRTKAGTCPTSNSVNIQQAKQKHTQYRSEVSSVSIQYYPQSNTNKSHTVRQEINCDNTSFVQLQQRRTQVEGANTRESNEPTRQYDTFNPLQVQSTTTTTDSSQILITRQQIIPSEGYRKPANTLPNRNDGIFEIRPISRNESESVSLSPIEPYIRIHDQPKMIFESGGSQNKEPDSADVGEVFLQPTLYIPNLRPETSCGRVTKKPSNSFPYDSSTVEAQWPWQVALYQQQTVDFKYICGGTLVSNRHVITAAHCVTRKNSRREVNKNTLTVHLGKFNLRTSVDGVQVKFVNQIIIHPSYNASIFSRNLAILVLQEPASYTDWVRPACLWPEDETELRNIVGRKGSVVGWGYDVSGTAREELSVIEMPVVDQQTCVNSHLAFYGKFTSDYTYCAGYQNGSTICNGDSGGGMVFKKDNTWYLRGFVSISVSRRQVKHSCDPTQYVIFTDVAKFLPWIEEYID